MQALTTAKEEVCQLAYDCAEADAWHVEASVEIALRPFSLTEAWHA